MTKKSPGKKKLKAKEYVDGILDGNITILSQAITLVESTLPKHSEIAQKIVNSCLPQTGNSIRIAITGAPGAGKSTFIESFGSHLVNKEKKKLAVLTIDPTSEITKGSILADKVRMETLSSHKNAYIRPTPSSGSLGGVARKTRETILLCEAAGFDVIIVETVGVGQSEIKVHSMVDFFLLLQLAGAGDEMQGIKRGIMEMADAIAITKADGKNKKNASLAKKEFENALSLFPSNDLGWKPRVSTCSSMENIGIKEIWKTISDYKKLAKNKNYFIKKRKQQAKFWMHETVKDILETSFYKNEEIKKNIVKLEEKVMKGKTSSTVAANKLLKIYSKLIS